MAESTAFSSSGSDIIAQTIELEEHDARPKYLTEEDLPDYYELERTVDEILKKDYYKRVRLVFMFYIDQHDLLFAYIDSFTIP